MKYSIVLNQILKIGVVECDLKNIKKLIPQKELLH